MSHVVGYQPTFTELVFTGATQGALFGLLSLQQMKSFPPSWKKAWLINFLAILCLFAYFGPWTWYRDSKMKAAVEELTTEMTKHGEQRVGS